MKQHPCLTAIVLFPLIGAIPVQGQESREFISAAGRKSYQHVDPTAQEQLMLELINRARADPEAEAARFGISLNEGLAPGTITAAPKPPLSPHPALFVAAQRHSRWMLESGVFSHTGELNSDPGDRMASAGYVFSGGWSWAENIGWGGTSGTPEITRETIARHEGLFRSPGHRTNICSDNNTNVGLGILAGRFQGWNAVMATQTFARSGAYPETLVIGVIFDDRDGDGFYDPGEGIPGVIVVPDSGDWQTVSSSSGGYAVPYSGRSGPLGVTFSGGPLGSPQIRTVQKTGGNLKIDLQISPNLVQLPEIAVQQPAGTDVTAGKTNKNFGVMAIGSKGTSKNFTIKNVGTADLTGLRVSKNGVHSRDFSVTSLVGNILSPGESTTLKVRFIPKGTGKRRATLHIRSNDGDEKRFDIGLTGVGK